MGVASIFNSSPSPIIAVPDRYILPEAASWRTAGLANLVVGCEKRDESRRFVDPAIVPEKVTRWFELLFVPTTWKRETGDAF